MEDKDIMEDTRCRTVGICGASFKKNMPYTYLGWNLASRSFSFFYERSTTTRLRYHQIYQSVVVGQIRSSTVDDGATPL